ncbi:hypothetical protein JOB18_016595, partial [Solea senegalensis]
GRGCSPSGEAVALPGNTVSVTHPLLSSGRRLNSNGPISALLLTSPNRADRFSSEEITSTVYERWSRTR